jgi:hypothetical protein
MLVAVAVVMIMVVVAAAGPVLMPVLVAMLVSMIVRVGVRRGVAVRGRLRMAVRGVGMRVSVIMVVVVMAVIVPVVAVATLVIGAALGLEGAAHRRDAAALPPHHFDEDMIVLDVDGVSRDLRRGVPVANVPSYPQETQGVLGADLHKVLVCRLDPDEAAILQLQGIAVLQRGGFLEVEQHFGAGLPGQRDAPAVPALMIEHDGIDDLVGLDGEPADDGGGAEHGIVLDGDKGAGSIRHAGRARQ